MGADFIDEVGLELGFGLEAQLRHFGLALGAFRPTHLGHFISADVDDLRREHLAGLVQHRFQKRHGAVVASAIHVLEHPQLWGTGKVSPVQPSQG